MFPVMLASVRYRALPTTFRRVVIGPVNIASTTAGDKPKLSMNWPPGQARVPRSHQGLTYSLPIAILHAAIVPKIVVEHECYLAAAGRPVPGSMTLGSSNASLSIDMPAVKRNSALGTEAPVEFSS